MKPFESSHPFTYMITAGTLTAENYTESVDRCLAKVEAAVSNRVSAIQVREKHLPASLLLELTVRMKRLIGDRDSFFIVNERLDVALAAGADGVHLSSASIPVSAVRKLVPPGFIVGVSTHTLEEASAAAREGADLAVFGPVFETAGKHPKGLAALRRACVSAGNMPVLGLGGIGEHNFSSVIEQGAAGIAAIGLFQDQERTKRFLSRLT